MEEEQNQIDISVNFKQQIIGTKYTKEFIDKLRQFLDSVYQEDLLCCIFHNVNPFQFLQIGYIVQDPPNRLRITETIKRVKIVLQDYDLDFKQKIQKLHVYQFQNMLQIWNTKSYIKPRYMLNYWNRNSSIKKCQILKSISHIDFPYMKTLSIAQSSVNNIQPLSWIKCPFLVTLNVSGNYICNLKVFSKTTFSYLRSMNIAKLKYTHDSLKYLQRMQLQGRMNRKNTQTRQKEKQIQESSSQVEKQENKPKSLALLYLAQKRCIDTNLISYLDDLFKIQPQRLHFLWYRTYDNDLNNTFFSKIYERFKCEDASPLFC